MSKINYSLEESSHLLTNNNDNHNNNTNNCNIHYGSHDDANELNNNNKQQQQQHKGTIGFLGSLSIAVNSLTGPAMLNLPSTFQRSGLIPTCLVIVWTCILSSLCSLHMADTISKLPNNDNFQKEYEFSDAFFVLFQGRQQGQGQQQRKQQQQQRRGRWWFLLTHVFFFGCVTCLNISSIVDTSQVVDTFLGHYLPGGGSVALQFSFHFWNGNNNNNHTNSPILLGLEWVRWDPRLACTEHELQRGECIAFGNYDNNNNDNDDDGSSTLVLLLTLGYILTGMIFLPMSLLDLKENSRFQIMGFLVLLVCCLEFILEFAFVDPDGDGLYGFHWENLSWWGTSWSSLVGVILFNYALVIAIPAWLYERAPSVPVDTVIHSSTILSSALYMTVGMAGAWAIPRVSDNMLESMISGVFGISMQLSASIFAFMIIGLGIPLFSVLIRLNLTSTNNSSSGTTTATTTGPLCSPAMGNVLAVYLPWSISWLLYTGSAITNLLSWGGVFFTSLVAFLLPIGLALYTVWYRPELVGSIIRVDDEDDDDVDNSNHHGRSRSRKTNLMILFVLVVLSILLALIGLWVG